jgi:hypothetical protein
MSKKKNVAYETLKHFPPVVAKRALKASAFCLNGAYVDRKSGIG